MLNNEITNTVYILLYLYKCSIAFYIILLVSAFQDNYEQQLISRQRCENDSSCIFLIATYYRSRYHLNLKN